MPKTYLRFSHYSHFFLFNLNVLSRVVFTSHVISRAREPGLLSSQHPVTAFQLLVPGVTGAAVAGETVPYYNVTITSFMLYRPDISGTLQMPDVLIGVW